MTGCNGKHGRWFGWGFAALLLCVAAGGGVATAAEPQAAGASAADTAVTARLASGIDVAHCIAAAGGATAEAGKCPGAVLATVREALTMCQEMSAKLIPVPELQAWALDLNGDGIDELAFAIPDLVACEGAWSLFDCGSLGCPKGLYQEIAGEWKSIGSISAPGPGSVTLLPAEKGTYRVLRIGCAEGYDCGEAWHYAWNGTGYDRSYLDVRGHRVEFSEAASGLRPLRAATALLATPEAKGKPMEKYAAGTEVALIGATKDGKYYYVSPCNACESGFVAAAQLGPKQY